MSLTRAWSLTLLLTLPALACSDDGDGQASTTFAPTTGPTTTGDPTGDGDGDDATTGDPTTTGDGDTTTTGDGDPQGSFCVHQCSGDADCNVNGMDAGLICEDARCIGAAGLCTGDEECVALYSGWATPCTAGGNECADATQVCIQTLGEARCAYEPGEFIDCATLQMQEIPATDVNGNPVTVCGRPQAACHPDAYCFLPCESNNDCLSAAYPICNVSTGLCGCGQDSDCATLGLASNSVCNAGICGCGSDADCAAGDYGDVCYDGFCGCSGDAACEGFPSSYDGGSVVCAPL